MHSAARLGLVLTMLLALILAACSTPAASPSVAPATPEPASEAPATVAPASEAPPSVAPSASAPASAPASGDALVAVGESDLGQILVDGEGNTLYLFTADAEGEPTCYDDCATSWPPLLAEGEITTGAGLDDASFSTVERTDGTMQVKIGEWPLYYFAGDAAAGETNGQGVGERWYVVSPTGEAIQ